MILPWLYGFSSCVVWKMINFALSVSGGKYLENFHLLPRQFIEGFPSEPFPFKSFLLFSSSRHPPILHLRLQHFMTALKRRAKKVKDVLPFFYFYLFTSNENKFFYLFACKAWRGAVGEEERHENTIFDVNGNHFSPNAFLLFHWASSVFFPSLLSLTCFDTYHQFQRQESKFSSRFLSFRSSRVKMSSSQLELLL